MSSRIVEEIAKLGKPIHKHGWNEPIQTFTIPLPLREVDNVFFAGFRQEWASGKIGEEDFEVNSGAGLGSGFLTIRYGDRWFAMNLYDFMDVFFAAKEVKTAPAVEG